MGLKSKPCPNCKHRTPHRDQEVYCELPGCDCDRTDVEGFYED